MPIEGGRLETCRGQQEPPQQANWRTVRREQLGDQRRKDNARCLLRIVAVLARRLVQPSAQQGPITQGIGADARMYRQGQEGLGKQHANQ